MLSDYPVITTVPVTNLQKAKEFYEGKLGLKMFKESAMGILYKTGNTNLYIYERGPSKADHTLASFIVESIEDVVDELTEKGVMFEQYDYPHLKTNEKGIATLTEENELSAWFKDPDGNILAISQQL